jgi:hypothetical protein
MSDEAVCPLSAKAMLSFSGAKSEVQFEPNLSMHVSHFQGPDGNSDGIELAQIHVYDLLSKGLQSPIGGLGKGIISSQIGNFLERQRPHSKYDPRTGRFYRSITVDQISSVVLNELIASLSAASLSFDRNTFSGVITFITGGEGTEGFGINLTCVADTHLHADSMYERAEQILVQLLSAHASSFKETEELPFETLAGFTLLCSSQSEADSPSIRHVSESDAPSAADPLYQAEGETCCGVSLFRDPYAPPPDWSSPDLDTAAGVTLFSLRRAAAASPPPPGPGGPPTAGEEDAPLPLASLAWAALRGWWQDPAGYTEEQAQLSDMAWGVSA